VEIILAMFKFPCTNIFKLIRNILAKFCITYLGIVGNYHIVIKARKSLIYFNEVLAYALVERNINSIKSLFKELREFV
jgi:hypothetical protein